jgi:heme/copper-type cytochrome/quinol oxidase subunit 2
MPDRLPKIIFLYLFLVLGIQTFIRWIYHVLPWGINSNPSQEYLMAQQFFEPNNLTIIVTVIFIILTIAMLIFDPKKKSTKNL